MPMPLDTWRAFFGLHPYHFWQLADTQYVPVQSKCGTLLYEYDWMGSDAAGRSSIRQAIQDASEKFKTYLGYRPMPEYVDYALVDWPRYYEASQSRVWDFDATWRRVAVEAPEGYIQAMGVESLTLIGTAAVALNVQAGTTLYRSFTCTIVVPAGTSANDLAVYFNAADRPAGTTVGARWRVEPLSISISGVNATITGDVWLIVQPLLYEIIPAVPLDPTNAASFVASLDVYLRTTDQNGNSTTTAQATLVYETNDCGACWGLCCCGSGTMSSDPGTTGEVIARAGIRDKELGLITPAASVYDPSSATWSSVWCCSGTYCDPDRVKLRYLAGFPLENGQIAQKFYAPYARLAAAELKRRICACREQNEALHDMQQDLTLESTQSERYVVSPADLDNPFGTRRGHVQSWRAVRYEILRRGISA